MGSGRVWAHLMGFGALRFSPRKAGAQESVQQGESASRVETAGGGLGEGVSCNQLQFTSLRNRCE